MGDLIISEEVLEIAQLSPEQLTLEIAVYLYAQKKLTIGQASRLAGLDLIAFQKELAKRDVYIHYSLDDVKKDLANLRNM